MPVVRVLSRVARWLAGPRPQPELSCDDCERVETCGQPPSETCVTRLAQLERAEALGLPARREPVPIELRW